MVSWSRWVGSGDVVWCMSDKAWLSHESVLLGAAMLGCECKSDEMLESQDREVMVRWYVVL